MLAVYICISLVRVRWFENEIKGKERKGEVGVWQVLDNTWLVYGVFSFYQMSMLLCRIN